jgi:epoxyqueuosine reductase
LNSEELIQFLREKGYLAKIIDSNHLEELKRNSEQVYNENKINKTLYQQYLTRFDYSPTLNFTPRSIVIVAVHSPKVEVTFQRNQKIISTLIPPTYLYGNRDQQRVLQTANSFLQPQGFQSTLIRLPHKLVATRSGLTVYGRNNISYTEKTGSFHRLVTFASDLPCDRDHWTHPQLADTCPTCNACVSNCPTQAIRPDRFVISAEKCLTYHNEQPNHIPFPQWINPDWHNCLIGCMKCQDCCPMNRKNLSRLEPGPFFSHEETMMLLQAEPSSIFPAPLTQKLNQYDLTEYLDVIPRNLRTLLDLSNV